MSRRRPALAAASRAPRAAALGCSPAAARSPSTRFTCKPVQTEHTNYQPQGSLHIKWRHSTLLPSYMLAAGNLEFWYFSMASEWQHEQAVFKLLRALVT